MKLAFKESYGSRRRKAVLNELESSFVRVHRKDADKWIEGAFRYATTGHICIGTTDGTKRIKLENITTMEVRA